MLDFTVSFETLKNQTLVGSSPRLMDVKERTLSRRFDFARVCSSVWEPRRKFLQPKPVDLDVRENHRLPRAVDHLNGLIERL